MPNGVAGKFIVVNSRDGAVMYKTVEKFGNAAAICCGQVASPERQRLIFVN